MKQPAQRFLTENERDQVTETVRKAESRTSGEIVPMIVSASYDYPKARLAAALLFSIPLALLFSHLLGAYLWLDPRNVYFFLSLLIPFFLLCNWIVNYRPALAKLFISEEEMALEVEEEAIKSFFKEKLHATREATGILLFISVFEKKAWILADHGIAEKIDPGTWEKLLLELTARIGGNDRCAALCDTIEQIGRILERHFPYKRDDRDELHNLIVK
jgi:putative membrane protein